MKGIHLLLFIVLGCACVGCKSVDRPAVGSAPGNPEDPITKGSELSKQERIAYASTVIGLFEEQYAPMQWKEDFLGISFDELSSELMGKAMRASTTTEEFYAALLHFTASFRDAHVKLALPSQLEAELPFGVEEVEGEILVDWVDRDRLSAEEFPFQRGDRLLLMDGQSVENVMEGLGWYYDVGYGPALERHLANFVTFRSGMFFPDVPSGNVRLMMRSRKRNFDESIVLPWLVRGESAEAEGLSKAKKIALPEDASPLERLKRGGFVSNNPDPFFPLWEDFYPRNRGGPYLSGVFSLEDKKVGFLRIHTWLPDDNAEALDFLKGEIEFFEKNTDALIVDQTDNLGGDICFGADVVSLFAREPIPYIKIQLRTGDYWLELFEEYFGECGEEDMSDDCMIARNLIAELNRAAANGDELTAPSPLCSPDGLVQPHAGEKGKRGVYTKPVLMLINEVSMSTADMVPATLKAAGRVVMFGTRTCGAGGSVGEIKIGENEEFTLNITQSLVWLEDAVEAGEGIKTHYIENVGVTPDIEYHITVNDFLGGYLSYRHAVEQSVLSLMDQNEPASLEEK